MSRKNQIPTRVQKAKKAWLEAYGARAPKETQRTLWAHYQSLFEAWKQGTPLLKRAKQR